MLQEIFRLEEKARQLRKSIVRTAFESGRLTHPGPALSCAVISQDNCQSGKPRETPGNSWKS